VVALPVRRGLGRPGSARGSVERRDLADELFHLGPELEVSTGRWQERICQVPDRRFKKEHTDEHRQKPPEIVLQVDHPEESYKHAGERKNNLE